MPIRLPLLHILAVALGGAVGAVARYTITHTLMSIWARPFPLGTLVVNSLGCLLIGALMTWFVRPGTPVAPLLQLAIVTGVLGALTTYSSFGYETLDLWRRGLGAQALLNVFVQTALGLGAVALGMSIARRLIGA